MFSHLNNKFDFPQLEEVKVNGLRYYKVDDDLFPSVTTILSIQNNEGLQKWRERMGEEVANFESRRAANRGNGFHKICELYLNNQDISDHRKNVLSYGLFNLVKNEIERIDNIHGLETTLHSTKYKIAGRTDCIAEFDGMLSIIDFKSANRARTDDLLEKHSIQETAYAKMWEELTNIPIEQIVTIVACENGDSQTVIKKTCIFFKTIRRLY